MRWRVVENKPALKDPTFRHACKLGLEGIVSKRLGSTYRSGRSRHWIKSKNPKHPAVKRKAEEDWRA
jgi:bifunctional non-homologous end joining protein LigD